MTIALRMGILRRPNQATFSCFTRTRKAPTKGERVKFDGALPAELAGVAKHSQVYRETRLPIAKCEQIRITAGGTTKDGKHKLNNGTHYEVADVLESGDLKLTNGWIVAKDFGFLQHGYVSTSYASQGRTVDQVLIAEPSHSFGAAGAEQLYVSLSRGRKGVRLYTDDRQALKAAVHRSSDRLSATEMMGRAKTGQDIRRLQFARHRRSELGARAAAGVPASPGGNHRSRQGVALLVADSEPVVEAIAFYQS